MDRVGEQKKPELFFGLVGAVGTDLDCVADTLKNCMLSLEYDYRMIQMSRLLSEKIPKYKNLHNIKSEYTRIEKHMDKGDELRRITGDNSALALLSIDRIRFHRHEKNYDWEIPLDGCAFILKSLKRPEEVEKLRNIYGLNFWLIAAYCPEEIRKENSAKKIAESISNFQKRQDHYMGKAKELIKRDERDHNKDEGQNVQDTFPLADVFVDASEEVRLGETLTRFLKRLFRDTFRTPTRDEYGMFHAYAASLRSSSLSRRVGAVITTEDGDVIATGLNEVPKAGGGFYGEEDLFDDRDFQRKSDTSDSKKRELLEDLFQRLKDQGWLAGTKTKMSARKILEQAWNGKLLKGSQIMNLIEFARPVHAETAALIDAARRSISVEGGTLYTTTFPCHDCAKHIVAAGIRRVVYVHPYPKSLALEMYCDSIVMDKPKLLDGRVSFESFVGLSPYRYMKFFSIEDVFPSKRRKDDEGNLIPVSKLPKTPRFAKWIQPKKIRRYATIDDYTEKEQRELHIFRDKLIKAGLFTRPAAEKAIPLPRSVGKDR